MQAAQPALRLQEGGEVVTGLLFVEDDAADMHALNQTVQPPLYDFPYDQLCPGSAALDALRTSWSKPKTAM